MPFPKILLHHTETVDPQLVVWMRDIIENILGLGPWSIVIVIGIIIFAIPVWLTLSATRRHRHHSQTSDDTSN